MMFEYHKNTIDNLQREFEANKDYLAFIVNGSVARGSARKDSDVDYYLVVANDRSENAVVWSAHAYETSKLCVPPCPEANGFLISKDALKHIRNSGNEIDRWSFYKAMMVFCRDAEIAELVKAIPHYPEEGRIRRMESYHSQMYYHFSFFEYACYSQTKYLIFETATKMILSIGRLILADNRMLYPNRKRFYEELEKAPDKPEGICQAMLDFLDSPTIESANRVINMVQSHKQYPAPPEGMKARLTAESILNLEEW